MSSEEKATYRVKGTNIRHGGKVHRPGKTIVLPAEEAHRLRAFLEPADRESVLHVDPLQFEEERNRLQFSISKLEGEVVERNKTIESLNGQLAGRESDLNEMTAELNALRDQAAGLEQSLQEKDNLLVEANKELAALKKTAEKGGKK